MAESKPEDALSNVARSIALSSRVYSDALSSISKGTASIDTVTRAVIRQQEIERKLFGSTSAILKRFGTFNTISPSIQSIVAANSSLTRMVERIAAAESAAARSFADQKRIQDVIKGIGLANSVTTAFARIDSTRMLSASLAAQARFARLDNLMLGKIVGVDFAFSNAITVNLGNLTRSYQSLIDAAATREALAAHLPLITTYPPIEYYREIEVVETVTVDDADESRADAIDDAIIDSLPSIDDLLAGFDSRLCRLLQGARQALKDDNPDRVRHVTTSVRELFTQVLHALAPDADVCKWTTNAGFFHDDRPTRRARLLYICRHINSDPLSRFVEDDVRAALSFVELLNSGTHVVESKLTPIQLSSIVSRVESLLVFLLQIRESTQT